MAGINTTAADAARGAAFRTLLQNLLLNGTAGGLTIGAPTPGASVTSLGSILDLLELGYFAGVMLAENPNPPNVGLFPLQLPSFTTSAGLKSTLAAATYPGGVAFAQDIGTAGQPVYSDGVNWRRFDTNASL